MRFTKMQGAGNDYVYVNGFEDKEAVEGDLAELARQVSDRRFGVGGDGLIVILPSNVADARMRMFNTDGSEAEMCGNGLRCVARFVHEHGISPRQDLKIETLAGVLNAWVLKDDAQGCVRIGVGEPRLKPSEIPTTLPQDPVVDVPLDIDGQELRVTCVSFANPHCVVFVEQASDDLVLGLGPKIEQDPRFPQRVNVEFVEVSSRESLRQRTWERGSGETLACGTGAAAVCVAGVLTGRSEPRVHVQLLGGTLETEWSRTDNHVYQTGPTAEVFSGVWPGPTPQNPVGL